MIVKFIILDTDYGQTVINIDHIRKVYFNKIDHCTTIFGSDTQEDYFGKHATALILFFRNEFDEYWNDSDTLSMNISETLGLHMALHAETETE